MRMSFDYGRPVPVRVRVRVRTPSAQKSVQKPTQKTVQKTPTSLWNMPMLSRAGNSRFGGCSACGKH